MSVIARPITTERLVLRPFAADDLEDVLAIESRPEVVRYLLWDVRDRDEVRQVLEERATRTRLEADDDILNLAIVLPGPVGTAGHVIGEMSFWLRSMEHRQGEIGFVLHPDHQGRGYGTEAATAILDLAFGPLGLHRVYGRTDARNLASAALMRRLGMRQEAHFVHNEIFKGEWGDELVFAILDTEWENVRGRRTMS